MVPPPVSNAGGGSGTQSQWPFIGQQGAGAFLALVGVRAVAVAGVSERNLDDCVPLETNGRRSGRTAFVSHGVYRGWG